MCLQLEMWGAAYVGAEAVGGRMEPPRTPTVTLSSADCQFADVLAMLITLLCDMRRDRF